MSNPFIQATIVMLFCFAFVACISWWINFVVCKLGIRNDKIEFCVALAPIIIFCWLSLSWELSQ